MTNLKETRDELLSLHKTLMNLEREKYESEYGSVTNMQLLTLLFENENFIWLREISTLVAQIDEAMASKTGLDIEKAELLLAKAEDLIHEDSDNEVFRAKYQANLNTESLVSDHHYKLRQILKKEKA